MKAALARVRSWIEENVPAGECVWHVGAEGEPDDARLPASLVELTALANGSEGRTAALDSFSVCSREQARLEKEMMDELADEEEEWDEAWWSKRWYPFASDGAGQLLVVHMDTGEVIEFMHDDEPRPVRGASVVDFLEQFATSLEQGARVYAPSYGIIEADLLERIEEQKRVVARRQAEFDETQKRATWALVAFGIAIAVGGLLLSRL